MKKNKNKKIDNENQDTSPEEKEINESNDEVSNEEDSLKKELELAIHDKKRALAEAENTRRRSIKDLENPLLMKMFRIWLDTETEKITKEEIEKFRKFLITIEKRY